MTTEHPLTETPAAEVVELPGKHPAHITDVEHKDGVVCAYMALGRYGHWVGVGVDGALRGRTPRYITAFTLPDGTRARRDGDRPDGTPRFVKAGEGDQ